MNFVTVYTYYDHDVLIHHGIMGQKWGKRNGPPYPLSYGDHSAAEKRQNAKAVIDGKSDTTIRTKKTRDIASKSLSSAVSEKSIEIVSGQKAAEKTLTKHGNKKVNDKPKSKSRMDLKSTFDLTDEEAEKIKKQLKIAGIALGTTAAIVAAGYFLTRNNLQDINKDGTIRAIKFGEKLFNNPKNGGYVGTQARINGYHNITAQELNDVIARRSKGTTIDYNKLAKEVAVNQRSFDARRRLSCWSASNAYFMSAMTGEHFASKSFNNLVDFNDFGKLYTKKPEIFNILGMKSNNFVGHFGKVGIRGGHGITDKATKTLVSNIFKNISDTNNISADGTRTVGFINAGYHSMTCTHQFNFELVKDLDNVSSKVRSLFITDGYTGERYHVGTMNELGNIMYNTSGFAKLSTELHHYNANSVRFYAPSLDSLNTEMLSKVILGKG